MLKQIGRKYMVEYIVEKINIDFVIPYIETGVEMELFGQEFICGFLRIQWQYMVEQITRNEMYADKNPIPAKF